MTADDTIHSVVGVGYNILVWIFDLIKSAHSVVGILKNLAVWIDQPATTARVIEFVRQLFSARISDLANSSQDITLE